MTPRGYIGTVTRRWRWGRCRRTTVTQTSRNVMSLFRMLAEDSSELLRPQTVATYHVVRVVIQEQCASTGQVQLNFFRYRCQM